MINCFSSEHVFISVLLGTTLTWQLVFLRILKSSFQYTVAIKKPTKYLSYLHWWSLPLWMLLKSCVWYFAVTLCWVQTWTYIYLCLDILSFLNLWIHVFLRNVEILLSLQMFPLFHPLVSPPSPCGLYNSSFHTSRLFCTIYNFQHLLSAHCALGHFSRPSFQFTHCLFSWV